jgi:asparagine synthase (glutamine-hydrolysing)
MCGICGIAFSDGKRTADPLLMQGMIDSMFHRGPDGKGCFSAPGIDLGMRRLSIIDPETGDQPISSEDGAITIVCNGEIYNYVELRRRLRLSGHEFRTESDVEVIVHLYEQYGVECLGHLRGMFSFALWDARGGTLLLARDRLGIKPLHYSMAGGALYFASEQKSILASGALEARLDVQALRDLFFFGFVGGSRTMCTGLHRLLPGHFLVYRRGEVTVEKYWDVSFPGVHPTSSLSVEEWAEALHEKLVESVRIHLRSDVPVGAWLSAGIDSSGIVSLMCSLLDRPVQTFSIAFENPQFDEVTTQRTLADFTGYPITNERIVCGNRDFELLPKALWHCEDLSTSGLEIPRMMLAEFCSRHVKVVLTGEGSDEIFGGYGWFHADKYLRPLAKLPLWLRRLMLLGPLLPRMRPSASRIHLAPREMGSSRYRTMIGPPRPEIMYQLLSGGTRAALEEAGSTGESVILSDDFRHWHPFNQLQFHEMKMRLPDFILRDLDRTTMAHSLEARVPFLDHELVEMCARIPPSMKMRGLTEKFVLRQAFRSTLPEEIALRRKRGLKAPYEQWLREKLPPFAEEMLDERCLRQKGYFSAAAVKHLMHAHRSGRDGFGKHLMAVLVVQLWDEIFLRGTLGAS